MTRAKRGSMSDEAREALKTAMAGLVWTGKCRHCKMELSGTPLELAAHKCEG